MRLFFDARTIRPGMTGVGRYSLELLAALAQALRTKGDSVGGIARIRALALAPWVPLLQAIPGLEGIEWVSTEADYELHPSGDFWERFHLPRIVESDEIFHGPAFRLPAGAQKFKRVVTIHDLGVFKRPQDSSRKFGIYMRWTIRCSARDADAIIVPTKAVAEDLIRILNVARERIHVIPEAPTTRIEPLWPSEERISNDPIPDFELPTFVSIGTLESRKSPFTALRALEKLTGNEAADDVRAGWIWIGAAGHGKLDFLRELRESDCRDRFRCIGPRSRSEIASVLARSVALVYPSLDEGFGIPPLEAMAEGTPVVVSDIAPLREVCADAALYFPAGDSQTLVRYLRKLMKDETLRSDLIRRGRERAAEYSWQTAAMKTIEMYSRTK